MSDFFQTVPFNPEAALLNPLLFWGKASPALGQAPFHPLVFHSLDVATVFEALLHSDHCARSSLESFFCAPIERFVRPLAALVALHDIGKSHRWFQAKSQIAWPSALGSWSGDTPAYDHAAGSLALLQGDLDGSIAPLFQNQNTAEKFALLSPIAYHHGKPCDRTGRKSQSIDKEDAANARLVAEAILSGFDSPIEPLPFFEQESAERLSWLLSGLVSLADWVGSSIDFFPYCPPENFSPGRYFIKSQAKARFAVHNLRLGPTPVRPETDFASLFQVKWAPSAAQAHCAELPLTHDPMLVFIEDITGSGKTESALLLAHRMMLAGKGRGIFIALPTMATANAMYSRMADCYLRMFAEGERPSLTLAHGRARLHEGFRRSILPRDGMAENGLSGEIETVHAGCSAFFADDRRKALLADVGVGTVDQALLAVLPTKYATLRQYGLSGKILVIDEAHAYDAYMSREVERLLTFHAGLGGSAVILSATLPRGMKEAYARAFRGGAYRDSVPLENDAYPLVTSISYHGAPTETPLAARDDLRREVRVTRLGNSDEAIARLAEAAQAGAAVAYIRNSVDDAIEAYLSLRAMGFEALLFHARFAMCDRLQIEDEALETFGRNAEFHRRVGRILIATQVVEQSLDLDFDLLVSDLAPIDLLVQRAGRLWRHARGKRPVEGPNFLVVSPEPIGDARVDWFASAFPRGAYVYRDHALLWLSAKTLFEAGAIHSPAGVRALIEMVYCEQARDIVPDALHKSADGAEGRAYGDKSQADNNLLVFSRGYGADHRGWSDDVNTPTRLGEEQTTFRLAFWQGNKLRPYAADANQTRAWALSEVSVRAFRAKARAACSSEVERAAEALEDLWRKHGDRAVILPFLDEKDMRAMVVDEKGEEKEAFYNRLVGLHFFGSPCRRG